MTQAYNPVNCPFFRQCGGCRYYHDRYDYTLFDKQKKVKSLLSSLGQVHPIIGMEYPYHYRNKAVSEVRYDYRKKVVFAGKYSPNSHKVARVNECLIENIKANHIINSIVKLMKSFKYMPYDEDVETGLIRHIMIRNNAKQDQYMVILVVSDPRFPSKKNFVSALTKLHPEISTIILNVNNRNTSMVLGEKQEVIYGKGTIEDKLMGLSFRISAKSFYQVNQVQTEVIYKKALELAAFKGTERILDAYSGIGTIGLIAAKYVKSVTAVELNKDAVRDAVNNAKLNQIENVQVLAGDAGDFLTHTDEQFDVVIMDPPRSGSTEEFMMSMVNKKIEKIVYISCNPETLARDVTFLNKHGYSSTDFYPIDNFPFTDHVETVVLMSRK